MDIALHPAYGHTHKKRLQEKKSSEFLFFDDRNLKELFDIIILTGCESDNIDFVNDWKSVIQGFHCIIIQQGDPNRTISRIPTWLEYELYTKTEIERDVGKDRMWIFDIDANDFTAANFGFLVSDRDFIFLLNAHMKPIINSNDPGELLRIHALNLMKPTVSSYYNNGHDPYQRGKDFVKGYPYSLRDGIATAMSYGTVRHSDQHYDGVTKILRKGAEYAFPRASVQHRKNRLLRGRRQLNTEETKKKHTEEVHSTSIPKGIYFSLSLDNFAFNRKIIGGFFCLLTGLEKKILSQSKTLSVSGDYYHILLGWMMKTLFDNVGLGIKHFDSSSLLEAVSTSFQAVSNEKELLEDVLWFDKNEEIIRFYNSLSLSEKAYKDIHKAMFDLLSQSKPLFHTFTQSDVFYNSIVELISTFEDISSKRNAFHTALNPVAHSSSFHPHPQSFHQCALFTIIRNDTEMLRIWLRYYTKHFEEGDIYIFHHREGQNNIDPLSKPSLQNELEEQESLTILSNYREKHKINVFNVFDDNAGFPLYLFIQIANNAQRRLLRYGYKCVLLTDVDEMLIADPDLHPKGLKDYLHYFVHNRTDVLNTRARGYMLAHISESETGNIHDKSVSASYIEPPLDWSAPLLTQRHYWAPQAQYNKPCLSKVPTRHKPGFHNYYVPQSVGVDNNLFLLHLRDMDFQYCTQRERRKAELAKLSHQSEIDASYSAHLIAYEKRLQKGEVCQFSIGVYLTKYKNAYDNTGRIVLERIVDKWQKIII
jgi:reversibly glycosylated polypeptide/UDP-arabinopyranose mutase